MKTKTTVEILLKSLDFTGIPEKRLLISRNLLTVDLIWPRVGVARKSASRQVKMKKGAAVFTGEPWAKRILHREEIDGHTAFVVSLTEPVSLQKLHRFLQLTAKLALREGAEMVDAMCVSYGDIAAAPVTALATMVGEKDAPRIIAQGVLDYDDLPAAGEEREVVIPLERPKTARAAGSLTLTVRAS